MEVNNSIKCGVHDCKHHAGNVEYCTLNCVSIGACECSPKTKEGRPLRASPAPMEGFWAKWPIPSAVARQLP